VGDEVAPIWAPFLDHPELGAVLSDFDGTLSPIVDDPGAARPLPGVVATLAALARRYGRVGVLSGRPVSFLAGIFDPAVVLVGLYGLESVHAGRRREHPMGEPWRAVIDEVAVAARTSLPDGVLIEPKGFSITLHYRSTPDAADAVLAFARRAAESSGLECRGAKMSVELHPPIAVDKGTALVEFVDGLRAVCFIGDDEGDLPAFDALDGLAAAGVHTVRVVVRGEETSAALLARADVVLDGPEAVQDLLESLLPAG
jgi:trehalose 6-phosphate phosphatase